MQFKHPEILYSLLLLIIPILVHLFQLQKFVKVPFTNVKILKNIEKNTRKSARLKKWLILTTRLLIFTCLIFAFSQPYFSKYSTKQNFNTTVYLDNSYSMQIKGENGELLKSAAQDIIKNSTNSANTVSLITNEKKLKKINFKSLKNELINIKYHPNKLSLNTILLKIKNLKNTKINTVSNTLLISDFQSINLNNKIDFSNVNSAIHLLKLIPKQTINFYIDSVSIYEKSSTEITINVLVKCSEISNLSIPVSLFNSSKLIGKTLTEFKNSKLSTVQFTIPNSNNFNGEITLIDDSLEFDNDFYFSISKPDKINVLSIGNSSHFLQKIYTKNEFNYTATLLKNLNYNNLQNQHLIILNEIDNIPLELIQSLNDFYSNGGNLAIIPSQNSRIDSYNTLLSKFNIGKITEKIETEHKITSINYQHPLIKDVFEKKVDNFQYPKTSIFYKTILKNNSYIVKLDNNQSFISSIATKNSNFYWVSSPLNENISNFKQSPLVVPIFYNFARNSLKTNQLYHTINTDNQIDIKATIKKDNVLTISNESNTSDFIPLQNSSQNKVTLHLNEHILKSGFYHIFNQKTLIKTIAFNYNREESSLNYLNLKTLINEQPNVTIASSIDTVFNKISNQQQINWLFKWFLAFSILFLLIEMLILKYFNK